MYRATYDKEFVVPNKTKKEYSFVKFHSYNCNLQTQRIFRRYIQLHVSL